MTETELVLYNIELCQKLVPIMDALGIKQDAVIMTDKENNILRIITNGHALPGESKRFLTWRLDKLLLGLPDWCLTHLAHKLMFSGAWEYLPNGLDEITRTKIANLIDTTACGYHNYKLEAAAKLLILLWDEGLIEVKE